jgi:ABC-2 type transport system permease protein
MHVLHVLARRRRREWRNAGRLLRRQPALKIAVIGLFALAFEMGLFLLFAGGFRFLHGLGGAGVLLLNRLFALYFLGMAAMLTVSAAATAYGSLFRAGDMAFLLTAPVSPSGIVLAKWAETTRLSTWAYGCIVLPFVAAFTWYERGSPLFVLWTVLFSVPLLACCSGVGLLAALVLARVAPRRRAARRLAAWGLAAGVAAFLVWLLGDSGRADLRNQFNLATLVPGLRLATHPLLPGYWISEGLTALREGAWLRGTLFWLLLTTTAGVIGVLVEAVGSAFVFDAWTRLASDERTDRRAVLLSGVRRFLPFPPAVRALLLKDIRLFLRDPLQWSQVAIFFGLLGLYFGNLRSLRYHLLDDGWRSFMAFLNAFSVAAVLSSLNARFVFPQLSLEGQGFWLLGLSPAGPRRVLKVKFAASLAGMLAVTGSLTALSATMLRPPAGAGLTIVLLMILLTAALAGLAMGLGAIFLDLENRNPAAIVSGFGGTLNLVLSLLLVLAVLVPFGALFHLRAMGGLAEAAFRAWTATAWAWALALCALATIWPLRAGVRALERRDY